MAARVLVVDDEPQVRRALHAGLRGNGYDVRLAASGEEALDNAALDQPDIVLLDLTLPDIDGLAVVRQLREWSRVPVVVSARDGERDKVDARDLGADDTQYLRTYVNQLRKKVESDSCRPTRIINEPGVGYRYRRDA